jgi:hypothetical protein
MYGQIRCIYKVLANPRYVVRTCRNRMLPPGCSVGSGELNVSGNCCKLTHPPHAHQAALWEAVIFKVSGNCCWPPCAAGRLLCRKWIAKWSEGTRKDLLASPCFFPGRS